MFKPPEHLTESECIWCHTKIRFIAEGVRNEKAEGYDLRMAGWVHLDAEGKEILPDPEVEPDHEPTPPLEVQR